jgi:replicative DNA helicase
MSNTSNNQQLIQEAQAMLLERLTVIPVGNDKRPSLPTAAPHNGKWGYYLANSLQAEDIPRDFSEPRTTGLGILAGLPSQGLEIVDVDTKYDISGSLWDDLQRAISDNLPGLLERLVIAKTVSGGRHLLYRCSEIPIPGNLKLAQRPGSPAELEKDPNDKQKVLIETRGQGGYAVGWPSPGYELIQGGYHSIPLITAPEREQLLAICRSFHELEEPQPQAQARELPREPSPSSEGLSPWEDYNQRGDVVALLEQHGWHKKNQSGHRVYLLRPGKEIFTPEQSGNYHTELRTLRVFSSSTQFRTDVAYSPFQVYTELECRGDYKLAARRLRELGYGDPLPQGSVSLNDLSRRGQMALTQIQAEQITVAAVIRVTDSRQVICSPGKALKIEEVEAAQGSEIVISSPGPEAREEVLKAIALAQGSEKRIYIQEQDGLERRSYIYQLELILEKYEGLQPLTDRAQDSLLEEVVYLAEPLPPVDRDLLQAEFLKVAGDSLGVSSESLATTVERLSSSRAKDEQQRQLSSLLKQVSDHTAQGDTHKAYDVLEAGLRQSRLITARDLMPAPQTYEELISAVTRLPQAKSTGYSELDKFVGFAPGAISLVAGRPSHGKTTLLFNLLLQMIEAYPKERFYFFTYEEPAANIFLKILSRLAGQDFKDSFASEKELTKPTNYEYLRLYLRKGYTKQPALEGAKQQLKELMDSQRLSVIDKTLPAEDLMKLITYLPQQGPAGAVFIDYAQRLRTAKGKQDLRTEVTQVSSLMLQAAKESGLPIIMGAQINRDGSGTGNKRPRLENLKESGSLEEDANTVLCVYNEEREDLEQNSNGYRNPRAVTLEVKALKNREGEPNRQANLYLDTYTGIISQNHPNSL